jgi:hypothetical protein
MFTQNKQVLTPSEREVIGKDRADQARMIPSEKIGCVIPVDPSTAIISKEPYKQVVNQWLVYTPGKSGSLFRSVIVNPPCVRDLLPFQGRVIKGEAVDVTAEEVEELLLRVASV